MNPPLVRIHIVIHGAVQGVGFRPFVFNLANSMNLNGWVSNTAQGVQIEAEGSKPVLDRFLICIRDERPARASIQSFEYSFLDAIGLTEFKIHESDNRGSKTVLILPDIATCQECRQEIFDPTNRRFQYPFTNCIQCGPRFTIIDALPYDRCNTSMQHFGMCNSCQREYNDPRNRRFHAQPNACPECGPELSLWETDGNSIAARHDALITTVELLKAGQIVAVKGLGGFHLMADAQNEAVIERLRLRKHREEKPLAVMAPNLDWISSTCNVNDLEKMALTGPESPLVLLERRSGTRSEVARNVAPRNPNLGIMLPYTPLHHLLMERMGSPIVATSGNHKDEPICVDEAEALSRLRGLADAFLVHNRPIRRHADDSIVRIILGHAQILRRARGYAPLPVSMPGALPVLLGAGGHLKNTVAISVPGERDSNVLMSQFIGDLSTREAYSAYRDVIADFERLFDLRIGSIACDAHPDYLSTQYSRSRAGSELKIASIQHHCAHVASCMADNQLEPPALGVAFDGSGYGGDETLWGGEFILATQDEFRRVGHMRTFPLPGGEYAVRKTHAIALGLLFEIFDSGAFDGTESKALRRMLQSRIHAPRTSSAGRLFDAVASMCGILHEASFEGQAAMELEFAVKQGVDDSYPFAIRQTNLIVVDWEPMIIEIMNDIGKEDTGVISARFHNTMAEMIVSVARRVGQKRVVLTGGCFQNRYLTERTVECLLRAGFQPYWHQRVPPNDSGIALGQVYLSAHQSKTEVKPCVLQSRAG